MAAFDCNITLADGSTHYAYGTLAQHHEDALALCMTRVLSTEMRMDLSKGGPEKSAIVHVQDPEALLAALDAALGIKGRLDAVRYTYGPNRDHFTKHMDDRWQAEVRFVWPIKDAQPAKDIIFQPGLCRPIDLETIPKRDRRKGLIMAEIEEEELMHRGFDSPEWIPANALSREDLGRVKSRALNEMFGSDEPSILSGGNTVAAKPRPGQGRS